ncbi:hypothetical protein DPMN_029714 [Dreissena polymorpha]|uniref:Uncharacterized protein n=1 Tax=Dreissena polymorpha TaxID=45954 RepID=A0A9D4LWX4_DREPO|nr:hypothetical protein DPMN_029714 [Dreissena polymorpha]
MTTFGVWLGNEKPTGVAVQEIPGFYNELYAYWGKPSTTTDHTKKKDYIRKEQSFLFSYKTRQIKKELEDCTYGVVNKNTRKHRDHASKDSVSSHADIIEQKNGGLYSMAREPNEKSFAEETASRRDSIGIQGIRVRYPSSLRIDSLVLLRAQCIAPIPGFHTSTSLVGWETLEAFLKFPVPRPGFEPGTSGMVDQSVTTRPPHHPL